MRKIVFMLLCMVLVVAQLRAQNRTLAGKVTDEQGNALGGASVLVKGTTAGTTTSESGTFTLSVAPSAKTLIISYQGYSPQELAIGNRNNYTVSMKTADQSLDEVVVVGYQVKRKRDDAGAISTVSAKQIENRGNISLDQALQGKAAGVLVQSNSGLPGGAITVRIRGAGSINAGNEPLYVVDGVQINTRNDASFTQNNPLSFLNPDDIESIDILKDAASAAIYGSAAANGVVLITTKKGKAGKTRLGFNTYVGRVQPLKLLNVLNAQQYYQLRAEAYANSNNRSVNDLINKQTVLSELRVVGATSFTQAQADSAIAALQTYDWQDAAFKNGSVQNYELNLSGGNEKTTFRLSTSHTKQDGVVTKANFKRSAAKIDLTNKVTDRLNVGTSLNLSSSYQDNPFAVSGSTLGNPAFSAAGIIPTNPIYNADGTYYGIPGGTPANLLGTLNQNIIAVTDFNSGSTRTNQLVGNINADYKITSWLTFRTLFGLDYRLQQAKNVRDARTPDAFVRKGLATSETVGNTNFTTYQTLNFNQTFGRAHKVDGLIGYEYRKEDQDELIATGEGFPTYQFTSLNNAANPVSIGEFYTGYRRNSVFGNLNYTINQKYLLGATVRYDGSSRFGANHRYGTFGGVKAAWNVDREDFLKGSRVISALKLRAGYGSVGNDQIGNFDALGLFGSGGVYNGSSGIAFTQLPNPELRWEKSTSLNLGMDFGFFKNRINGSFEVYDKLNSDLLLTQPLQSTTGFTGISTNIGKVSNKGVELTLGADIIRGRGDGFNWNSTFTFAYNKQEVKELYNDLKVLSSNTGIRVGEPVNVLFTQKYAGVNAATGRPMWYDSLGNITYQVQAKDRVVIGPTQLPKFNGGLRNTFSYKGFSLDAFLQYEYGRIATDGQVNFLIENIARINELQEVYEKRWTTPGQVTSYPRFLTGGSETKGSAAQTGDRTYFKADYIRLKNVMLSYEVSPDVVKRLKITNARIYVQGTNLATYSDALGYDVEFVGTATGIVPQFRNYTVGVQVGF